MALSPLYSRAQNATLGTEQAWALRLGSISSFITGKHLGCDARTGWHPCGDLTDADPDWPLPHLSPSPGSPPQNLSLVREKKLLRAPDSERPALPGRRKETVPKWMLFDPRASSRWAPRWLGDSRLQKEERARIPTSPSSCECWGARCGGPGEGSSPQEWRC